MKELFWVCLGGGLGSGARYLVFRALSRSSLTGFPLGTFAVNVIGSFLLGILMVLATETRSISPLLRLTLATGILGGFTTYSAFNQDTFQLLRGGLIGSALGYVGGTLITCLLAGVAGAWMASGVLSARA